METSKLIEIVENASYIHAFYELTGSKLLVLRFVQQPINRCWLYDTSTSIIAKHFDLLLLYIIVLAYYR